MMDMVQMDMIDGIFVEELIDNIQVEYGMRNPNWKLKIHDLKQRKFKLIDINVFAKSIVV